MQQHLIFITKHGHKSIGDIGMAILVEGLTKLHGTDTLQPYQLIDDAFLEIIEQVAKANCFIPKSLYQFMSDQKGQYCLIHVIPVDLKAFSALEEALEDFNKLIDLLNSGKDYEAAKREVFKRYVLDTDTQFTDSPEAGRPNCLCSRCDERIYVGSAVIRKWPTGKNTEYRYHPACLGMTDPGPADWSFLGYTCQKCGHRQQEQGDCAICGHWNMEELHERFTEDI